MLNEIFRRFHPEPGVLTRREQRRQQEEASRKSYEQRLHWERRKLLFHDLPIWGLGLVATGAGIGFLVSREPSLDTLVSQAKQLENDYKALNLNDRPMRDRYTQLIAHAFAQYFPSGYTGDQLVAATNFVDTHQEFVELYANLHRLTLSNQDHQALQSIYGFTKDEKVFIDLSHTSFHSRGYITSQGRSVLWNPLRTLRMAEAHEYKHLVVKSRDDDTALGVLFPQSQLSGKFVEGFRIRDRNSSEVKFWDFDEAAVELLATRMNNHLFGSWRSDYRYTHGKDITLAARNLDSLLEPANISTQDLAKYHSQSQLGEFLFLLVKRGGIITSSPQPTAENFRPLMQFGVKIATAIVENDERFLNQYIKRLEAHNGK